MAWRSETFLDIQTRLLAEVAGLQAVVLHNQQGIDLKGDTNQEHPYNLPMIALAFGGGEWRIESDRVRYADEYVFRLHVYQNLFADEHTGSASQAAALEHLDFIDQVINALDDWTGARNVRRFHFRQETLDEDRTHIVEHVLEFTGQAQDCSLKDKQMAAQTTQPANKEEIVRVGQSAHGAVIDFNDELGLLPENPYRP